MMTAELPAFGHIDVGLDFHQPRLLELLHFHLPVADGDFLFAVLPIAEQAGQLGHVL